MWKLPLYLHVNKKFDDDDDDDDDDDGDDDDISEKNTSKCLLKFLPRVLSVDHWSHKYEYLDYTFVLGYKNN